MFFLGEIQLHSNTKKDVRLTWITATASIAI